MLDYEVVSGKRKDEMEEGHCQNRGLRSDREQGTSTLKQTFRGPREEDERAQNIWPALSRGSRATERLKNQLKRTTERPGRGYCRETQALS